MELTNRHAGNTLQGLFKPRKRIRKSIPGRNYFKSEASPPNFSNHSDAMLLENKALIYCILDSHNEVLMHYRVKNW
jgi:hypothetical protein